MNDIAQFDLFPEEAAEKAVLSIIFQEPDNALATTRQLIWPGDFTLPGFSVLYDSLLLTHAPDAGTGEPVDLVKFQEFLAEKGTLELVGGPAALAELFTLSAAPKLLEHHLCVMLKERRQHWTAKASAAQEREESLKEALQAVHLDLHTIPINGALSLEEVRGPVIKAEATAIHALRGHYEAVNAKRGSADFPVTREMIELLIDLGESGVMPRSSESVYRSIIAGEVQAIMPEPFKHFENAGFELFSPKNSPALNETIGIMAANEEGFEALTSESVSGWIKETASIHLGIKEVRIVRFGEPWFPAKHDDGRP